MQLASQLQRSTGIYSKQMDMVRIQSTMTRQSTAG